MLESVRSYSESVFLLFVCHYVCFPGFNTKEGIAECILSGATFSLRPLPSLTSYFLPLLSALPFLLIKIYSHNLLLLSSRSERLIGNFSSKTIVQRKEMDTANLRAPCRYHGNISTRGPRAERGREGGGDMIKCEQSILI